MNLKAMVLLIVGVVSVALTLSVMASQLGADYQETAQGVASVSAALGFFGVVLIALMDTKSPTGTCVLFAGFAGIIVAFISKSLYDQGILIDEFITGSITMPDFMVIIVVLWVMIGIVLEVVRS